MTYGQTDLDNLFLRVLRKFFLFYFRSLNTPERFLEYRFEGRQNIDSKVDRLLEAKFAVLLASLYHWIPSRFLSAFGIGYLDIGFLLQYSAAHVISALRLGVRFLERFSPAISWNGNFLNGRFLEMGLIIIYNNNKMKLNK
ncbi:hypothetical protein GLOIN_2v1489076 [Rhizophagus irregularis DAOM 181602=DAOM 197198]|uniref:Uncharacterized protein n=1 Tax=Rhizophagus irregularis (strain DAOM 181602 / DAOM 197198 / MUCL 43194) TaxID=747089 RepID=A0A2P4NXF4_RHIID|nr:hypothetical protein GLOIN_2v1489076 [Rhizophagus irregularis DAOM 181602=DAOM 197198]POG57820.1 hypothetical protein GLOIN_2v1489076 [Rhizophagus irregularis DAOM 181602=DAOM 197198]|eukprot:XP_025164686.1 hypothetical protein GLOIN_2v1489076 [Rhizophagus irregularis DAOM 181602=DAOM 197198]